MVVRQGKTRKDLKRKVQVLSARIREVEETLLAIRTGAVDALVVEGAQGDQVFTLQGAETPYRVFLEVMNEGAVTLSEELVILFANRAFAALVKLPLDQVLGAPFRSFLAPGWSQAFAALALAAQAGQSKASKGELLGQAADGMTVPLYLSVNVMPAGLFGALCVVLTDLTEPKAKQEALEVVNQELEEEISERRQAEARLREAEAAQRRLALRDEAILANLTEGLGVYPLEGERLLLNPAGRRLFTQLGLDVPKSWEIASEELDWLPASGPALTVENLPSARVLRGETFLDWELTLRAKATAKECQASFNGTPVYDPGGRLQYGIVTSRDITERKRLEAERRNLEHRIMRTQKLESLGRLASGIAHDMNNVLGAILGLATAHQQQFTPGTSLHQAMETITRACLRGRSLVQGLLGLARKGLSEERRLSLNDLVREEAALLERTTLQKVKLVMDLEPDLYPVKGDGTALGQALMNLCINAGDAMPEGGILTLRTRNDPSACVTLEVEDTGQGMDADTLAKALDPFFTSKPQGQGTGLGLPLVDATVSAHRGSLSLKSALGQGTCVSIQLPRCEPAAEPQPAAMAEAPASHSLRILVVDDDELIRESLTTLLRAMGHTHRAVDSGEAALRALQEGQAFDGVILDMNMPGLGGEKVLPLLRAQCPDLPVLLATGLVNQRTLDLVNRVPGVTLLAKPFSFAELRQRLVDLR